METGENNTKYWTVEELFQHVPAEQPLGNTLGIREEVEEGLKRVIPEMVPEMIEAMERKLQQLLPVMVEEAVKKGIQSAVGVQKLSHNPTSRSLPHDAESPILRTLQLHFVGSLPGSFYTINHIKAKRGVPLMVELVDVLGSKVEDDPQASAKIKIVVLDGDFDVENREENFNDKVVKPRRDKVQLLNGDFDIFMKKGVATVSNLAFTDNSSHMRNGRFRLGAQIAEAIPGVAIREAVSDPFRVKEYRSQSSRKKKKRSLDDDVCCLKHIGPQTSKRLAAINVHTVKDFLQLYNKDENALRKIRRRLGTRKWPEVVQAAESCLSTKRGDNYHDYMEGGSVNNHPFETLQHSHMPLVGFTNGCEPDVQGAVGIGPICFPDDNDCW